MINIKSTGIIRRLDDLGRIVIPTEIRRRLNLKDNDPIEIGLEEDIILLRKYIPEDSKVNWDRAHKILSAIIPNYNYAILDNCGIIKKSNNSSITNIEDIDYISELTAVPIKIGNNLLAYLVVDTEDVDKKDISVAVNVLRSLLMPITV